MGFGSLSYKDVNTESMQGNYKFDFYPDGITLDPSMIQKIDLSPLTNIHRIGDNFLTTCWNTPEIILPTLVEGKDKSAPAIGMNFLANTASLKTIDLSKISKIDTIPAGFLAFTESLESVDLTPLSNATGIGSKFMAGSAIKDVDLTKLPNVTRVGNNFLAKCWQLEKVNMGNIKAEQIASSWTKDSSPEYYYQEVEPTCFVMYCEDKQAINGTNAEAYKYNAPVVTVAAAELDNYKTRFANIDNDKQVNTQYYAVRAVTFQ